MAIFIELHVFSSNRRVSINVDAISQIAELGGVNLLGIPLHGVVHRVDGGSVETIETYDHIQKAIIAEGGSEMLVPMHDMKVDA